MQEPKHLAYYTYGQLPHFDQAHAVLTITFRLADSLPQAVRKQVWEILSPIEKARLREATEDQLDMSIGSCLLRNPKFAEIVQSKLLTGHPAEYELYAWVIMPNHVHVLIKLKEGFPLGQVVKSWKGGSAYEINRRRNSNGRLWQPDYFDRLVRDEEQFRTAWEYIEMNPVKAGLVGKAEEWPYSSAGVNWKQKSAD